jgi:hypothetical protein
MKEVEGYYPFTPKLAVAGLNFRDSGLLRSGLWTLRRNSMSGDSRKISGNSELLQEAV